MVMAWAMIASRAARSVQRPIDHQAITPVWASLIKSRPWSVPAWREPWGSIGVITKPSSVQRSVIVRLLVACGMAAGCGGAHAQRAPRGAVYRRRGLLPRAQHALLTQTVHKKRADPVGQPPSTEIGVPNMSYTYCISSNNSA